MYLIIAVYKVIIGLFPLYIDSACFLFPLCVLLPLSICCSLYLEITCKKNLSHRLTSFRITWICFYQIPEVTISLSSVAQLCPTLRSPMNCSTPGLPVHHQLPGFTQTHVHRVSDAIQPSHPLASLSPPAPKPSQHQSLSQ